MPSELKDLLERGAERPAAEPDFRGLARRGRRRRYTQRATSGLAVVAVIALAAGVMLPRMRPPQVAFDSAPGGGVGTWEMLPPSPLKARIDPLIASDDHRFVILGGREPGSANEFPTDGAAYDLAAENWIPIAAPPVHADHIEMLDDGRVLALQYSPVMAAFYDFHSNEWQSTQTAAPIPGRVVDVVAWTGDELLVWGGFDGRNAHGDGAAWSVGNGWRPMAQGPLSPRSDAAWAWTGQQLLIWGGGTGGSPGRQDRVLADGAIYDPASDAWTEMAPAPLEARRGVEGVWAEEELLIAGGTGPVEFNESLPASEVAQPGVTVTESCGVLSCEGSASVEGGAEPTFAERVFSDGARYDPKADRWLSMMRAPKGYRGALGITTDHRVVAEGPRGYMEYVPGDNVWMARPPLPDVGAQTSALHTVSVHGYTVLLNSGGENVFIDIDPDDTRPLGGVVYDEVEGRGWDALANAATPQRSGAAVGVVGQRIFVWGGFEPGADHADGAILKLR